MIGLPSKYRFQVYNNCGEEIELGLKSRPQKLNSSGGLVYGAWVSVFGRGTDTLEPESYKNGDGVDNTSVLYLGLEIWYAWNFQDDTAGAINADGLVTLRLQSNWDVVEDEYQEDGNGIILASDYILVDAGTRSATIDIASGLVIF